MFRRHNKSAKSPFVTSSYARRLRVESLEDRRLLAVLTVQNNLDDTLANLAGDGELSLREAIEIANNPGTIVDGFVSNDIEDEIVFDPAVFTGGDASLIRLHGVELEITETLTIDASDGMNVTITADADDDDVTDQNHITDVDASFGGVAGAADDLLDDNSRVIKFLGGFDDYLTIAGLTITGGHTDLGDGGGIYIDTLGDFTLNSSTVSGNSTTGSVAKGGGIGFFRTNQSVVISDSTISDNTSTGSGGGISSGSPIFLSRSTVSGNNSNRFGGGISSSQDISLVDSTISANTAMGSGGGVSTLFGDVTISGSIVVGNRTMQDDGDGGGIYTFSGEITVDNSAVSENSTAGNGAEGAGIYTRTGSVSLTSSNVTGNSTTGPFASGGGIRSDSGDITLISSVVHGNSTAAANASGGGIATRTGSVSLTSSVVSENGTKWRHSRGGGIYARDGSVSLLDSTVSGNTTTQDNSVGGGIYTRTGAVTLTRSTISGNSTAGYKGGGVYTRTGAVALEVSTISGNTSVGRGGGIYSLSTDVSITSSTVSGNVAASEGGGVFIRTINTAMPFKISNSVIAGNIDSGTAPDVRMDSSFNEPVVEPIVQFSLIGVTALSRITADTGTGNLLDMPPLLGPLSDNGGPTHTHALLPGSPALDAGDPLIAFDPKQFDQRGAPFLRVADGNLPTDIAIDIGAYEAQTIASADFDSDGDVDGSDFLAWQRGFGTELAVRADGNSDDDTDVDASDLAAWAVSYGEGGAGFQTLGASDELAAESLAVDVAVGALFGEKPALRDDEADFVRSQVADGVGGLVSVVVPFDNVAGEGVVGVGVVGDSANSFERGSERNARAGIESELLERVFG